MTPARQDQALPYAVPASQLVGACWRKSRRSNSSGNCVEFADLPTGQVGIRDSKHPHGIALVFTRAEVATLIEDLRSGSYDHLLQARPDTRHQDHDAMGLDVQPTAKGPHRSLPPDAMGAGSPGTSVVRAPGNLSRATVGEVLNQWLAIIDTTRAPAVTIDLTGVKELDHCGISMIRFIHFRLQQRNVTCTVRVASPDHQMLIEEAGLPASPVMPRQEAIS